MSQPLAASGGPAWPFLVTAVVLIVVLVGAVQYGIRRRPRERPPGPDARSRAGSWQTPAERDADADADADADGDAAIDADSGVGAESKNTGPERKSGSGKEAR
ncbi:hypothetical protein OK074_4942 [Actinobacteria bacterium OK074]|nr:hypothetical protein OK074_4942 [Actinobacteria bacterium OK074]